MRLLWMPLGILLLLALGVSYALWEEERGKNLLTVSFFDVGQGDATFIETPNGTQVLIDGGKGRGVLRELGAHMGFFDRSIDVVIATHPDEDHIGGLVDVFARYDVATFLEPGVISNSDTQAALLAAVRDEPAAYLLARRGMRLMLDAGVELRILFPDREVGQLETNTASVVAQLVYGETEFLLTGDAPQSIERYLARLDGETLASDVLKVGHHGSRTSTAEEFLQAASPQYGVVSAGSDNRYGHPHAEVVDLLLVAGVTLFNTAEAGTVTFVSDGKRVYRK